MIKHFSIFIGAIIFLSACAAPATPNIAPAATATFAHTVATEPTHATISPTTESRAATNTIPSPAPSGSSIARYGIFEQTFNWNSASYSNPWEQVQVTVALTSPSNKSYTIGGFYYAPNTWRARFSPNENGNWTWQATIGDGARKEESKGNFAVTESNAPGFVRGNANNKLRWIFDDGAPYYPIGIGDCMLSNDPTVSPLNNMGFDGENKKNERDEGRRVDLDTYLKAYSAAGFNLFRWSVDNCAFKLYEKIDPSGNTYLAREGVYGDELAQKLRQNNFRIYMAVFGFAPPFPNGSKNKTQMDAIKRAVKYAVDRYGAYVDFWELMNEFPNPPATIDDDWYNQIGAYLKSIDPYRHPISTSWQRPDLAIIDITSPHWYQKENELESDLVAVEQIKNAKGHTAKPIIFGEQGNSEINWDTRSGLRMRLRSWTAFFNEAVLIFWNASALKDARNGVASNIYLGPEERGYVQVLQNFVSGLDARIAMSEITVSKPEAVRGYALRAQTTFVAYLHAYRDHTNPTTGIAVTVSLTTGGKATW
ncbi:MAG: DUF5060 domain-containing protein, partial [Chloroflexi bacterium]|nr:DUF5060 domain-containing protein [Chloroflexota bacterium]